MHSEAAETERHRLLPSHACSELHRVRISALSCWHRHSCELCFEVEIFKNPAIVAFLQYCWEAFVGRWYTLQFIHRCVELLALSAWTFSKTQSVTNYQVPMWQRRLPLVLFAVFFRNYISGPGLSCSRAVFTICSTRLARPMALQWP